MREPALVPRHVSLAEAARIAERHGFVLRPVRYEGRLRIAMVRPPGAAPAGLLGAPTGMDAGAAATADARPGSGTASTAPTRD